MMILGWMMTGIHSSGFASKAERIRAMREMRRVGR